MGEQHERAALSALAGTHAHPAAERARRRRHGQRALPQQPDRPLSEQRVACGRHARLVCLERRRARRHDKERTVGQAEGAARCRSCSVRPLRSGGHVRQVRPTRAAPSAVPQLHEPDRVVVGDLEAEVPAGEHAALRRVEGVAVGHRALATAAHIGTYNGAAR